MNFEYLSKAEEKIGNVPTLVNLVSYRTRQLIRGARRYVLQAFVPQDHLPGEKFRSLKRTTPERLYELEKLMAPFAENIIVRGA